jgi:uncharacterized membrane protein YhhN
LFLIWQGATRQNMQIPVIIYGVIIAVMLLTAIHSINNKSLKRLSKNYFIPGAILFVASDSILALNKFSVSIMYGEVIIMVTYAAAVFMLSMGVIKFLKK